MKIWKGVLIAGLLIGIGACDDDDDGTQPPDTETVALSTIAENVTGSAVITNDEGTNSTIEVTLQGLMPGETYPGHIHTGDCLQNPGPVVFPLETIEAPTGTSASITSLDVPDNLLQPGHYIQYHRVVDQSLPPVACGNIQ